MPRLIKVFIALCFLTLPVHAQDQYQEPLYDPVKEIAKSKTETKSLRSIQWNSQKDNDKSAENSTETEEEKDELWNQYKERDENTEVKEEEIAQKNLSEKPEQPQQAETPDAQSVPKELQPTGLQAILERYKQSQQGKGKLNSRSLGSID